MFNDYGDIEVTSIENYPYKNGAFILTSLKGDLSSNIKNFINDLSNEYGEISYRNDTSLLGKNFYSDLEAAGNLFDDLLIKISICIIITINFIINLLMIRKKITSLKLEGHSIFQIYNDFFLKNFIIYDLLFSLIFSVILFVIYGSNIYSFKIMIVLFYIQLVQMFLIQIFVSIFSCLIINNFEIVKSMKGYKNFNTIFNLIKLCKIVILILLIPLIKTNILNISNYYKITSRYEQVNKKLENYYYFSFIKNSNYVVGSKQAIAIRDQLVKEANLFEVIHTHYTNYDTFTPYGDFYAIDVNFANNCGLKIENEDEVYIFLREGAQYDEEFLKERALEFIDRYTNINIVYYDFNIESYIPNDLLYSDDLSDYPIFYAPEFKGYEAELNSKYFYYEGDLLECQDYIDSVFINNGFSPLFAVAKLSSQYKSEYDYRVEEIRYGWIVFVLLLISYIYLNILLIKIDMTNNKKKYFIKYCEGENPYNIFSFLKIFSITCLISLIISLIIDSLTISDVLYAIIFILLIEVICYLVSYKLGGFSHDWN